MSDNKECHDAREYVKKVCEKLGVNPHPISWLHGPSGSKKIEDTGQYSNDAIVALLVQQNMLLQRLGDLMWVATGLVDSDVPPSEMSPLENGQDTKKLKNYSIVCGNCGKGVVPDEMGYCPRCKNDLSKQILASQSKI